MTLGRILKRWVLCLPIGTLACVAEVEPEEPDWEDRLGPGACGGPVGDGGGDCVCPILVENLPLEDRFDWCSFHEGECVDKRCGKSADAATSDCAMGYSGEYCGCGVFRWEGFQFYPAHVMDEETCEFLIDRHPYYEFVSGDTPESGFEIHTCCG
ncbi:MAG: hypothetical protein K0V04_19890 [Deltaproteobacteria bacterium]|nr:hypothetical protein [Deltaproteobacteria bacterium]